MRGAILLGILGTTALGSDLRPGALAAADLFVSATSRPRPSTWTFAARCAIGLAEIVFVFLFVDLFDNIGTLVAVGKQARLFDEMHADSADQSHPLFRRGCDHRGIAGRNVDRDELHRERGGRRGGRTHGRDGDRDGAAVFRRAVRRAGGWSDSERGYGAGLIVVGSLMMAHAAEIAWSDPVMAIPAFLTIVTIPLTFSIANGLAFGFTAYTLLKIARGEFRTMSWLVYALTILFIARFIYLSTGRT